ncbi:MAG: M14 family metallopeptidase [Gemmatimonadota bacterium]
MTTIRLLSVCTLLLLAPAAGAAQSDYFFPPGQDFDPAVPTPAAFLGYDIGTHHTRHDQIVAYVRELARVSARATYQEIGRTYGERVMPVLTVTSPANHARLEEIRQRHLRAADPAQPAVPAADRPVIVHLGYGVHGNETSSSEAALLTAYWLVAARTPEVERYLEGGVYHIEPALNPDGRDRHTHWANMNKATPFVADPLDREHNGAWPGGRTNHYWFDLNRDWLPLENPESVARIDFHHRWLPNVVTDYHEMGTTSTYYFEPSEPVASWNPLIPERMYTGITEDFAAYYAAALDSLGSLYFTKEAYDNTYPGYGSTYPKFLGAYAITFEQASARGHVQESPHHGLLTFAFTIRNQLRTGLAAVRAANEQRVNLLEYQREFFTTALDEAEAFPVQAYVFGDPEDAAKNRLFLELLLRHRLEVFEVPRQVTYDGRTFAPGSAWIVPTEQPKYRMVRSIFERTSEYADSAFYDASTWTISLAYDMPDAEVRTTDFELGAPVTAVPAPVVGSVPRADYAYLLDWRDYFAPRALYYLLSRGVHAEVAFEPFTSRTNEGAYDYPRGSISIPVKVQRGIAPDELHGLVEAAARDAGVRFQSTGTGYAAAGVDLGSRNMRPLTEPRVLTFHGPGISAYEAGQIWHLLDTKFALPMTKVDPGDAGRVDFNRYDVIILPSGSYAFLSGSRLEELKAWVRGGGTLIAQRTAATWAVANGFAPNSRLRTFQEEEEAPAERRDWADADEIRGAQAIGGSIWRADVDVTHPLAYGYQRRTLPVWRDHAIFFEPSANPYSTVVQLTADPHLSGYISARNLERLRNSPSALVDGFGRGSVVLLVDNVNFRGYWTGTNRLLLNAILFGRHFSVPGTP